LIHQVLTVHGVLMEPKDFMVLMEEEMEVEDMTGLQG